MLRIRPLLKKLNNFGEMAERSNAAVLKTVDGQLSGGSNPSLSAIENSDRTFGFIAVSYFMDAV